MAIEFIIDPSSVSNAKTLEVEFDFSVNQIVRPGSELEKLILGYVIGKISSGIPSFDIKFNRIIPYVENNTYAGLIFQKEGIITIHFEQRGLDARESSTRYHANIEVRRGKESDETPYKEIALSLYQHARTTLNQQLNANTKSLEIDLQHARGESAGYVLRLWLKDEVFEEFGKTAECHYASINGKLVVDRRAIALLSPYLRSNGLDIVSDEGQDPILIRIDRREITVNNSYDSFSAVLEKTYGKTSIGYDLQPANLKTSNDKGA